MSRLEPLRSAPVVPKRVHFVDPFVSRGAAFVNGSPRLDEGPPTQQPPPPRPSALERFAVLEGCVVENKKNTARDLLATERTLLAWVRSSVMYASLFVILFIAYDQHRAETFHRLYIDPSSLKGSEATLKAFEEQVRFVRHSLGLLSTLAFALALICLLGGGCRYFWVTNHLIRWNLFPASRASILVVNILCLVLVGVTVAEFLPVYRVVR